MLLATRFAQLIVYMRVDRNRRTALKQPVADYLKAPPHQYQISSRLAVHSSFGEARHFFHTLAARENVDPASLVLHADNGAPMCGRALADLLESFGVERSHSRPRTSNDNAFSEAQFKTMKNRPTYPRAFETEAEARAWCREFFRWYNHEHRHEGLALLTPADVHFGRTEERLALRAETLAAACEQHPARFVKRTPTPKRPPSTVAINPNTQPPREKPTAGATTIPQAAEVAKWRQPRVSNR